MLYIIFFMRFPRVKVEGQSFYHCMSRVVDGRFIFGTSEGGSVEAEFIVALMRDRKGSPGFEVWRYSRWTNTSICAVRCPRPGLCPRVKYWSASKPFTPHNGPRPSGSN